MGGDELGARTRLAKKGILGDDDLNGPGGLECLYFNARSGAGKTDELRALMLTRNLDVVAVTETWLKEGQDWQLNILG